MGRLCFKTMQVVILCSLSLALLQFERLRHVHLVYSMLEREKANEYFQTKVDMPYQLLPTFLSPYSNVLKNSDFVQLDHCSFERFDWANFTSWALPVLDRATTTVLASSSPLAGQTLSTIRDEWLLELLEMHATHAGLCNFEKYQHAIPNLEQRHDLKQVGTQLQKVVATVPTPPQHARIAFTIVAYQDSAHLRRLIEAIHMPHHLIVIHLEQILNEPSFLHEVTQISSSYSNVVIVRFGTVIYETDSVSRINLQIMNWMVNDLALGYDYHVTLGGAVYPLHGASELAQHLYRSNQSVWLGEMTHKGNRVHHPQWGVLWNKRLMTSNTKHLAKLKFLFGNTVPAWMDAVLQHKSASGNQAAFSRSTVKRMLENPRVQNIFALAKYGCCCCIEERSWIAVMDILGLLEQAKENRNMFQLWGGDNKRCRGSMGNAVLDMDETRCFRNESPAEDELYVWGNSTWTSLVQAKQEGVMFVRKFHSNHDGSMELLKRIQRELHGN